MSLKLTKFAHSCVLVENENEAVLFDPGMFSWNSGLVNVAELPRLAAVVITHQHPDHFSEPFVRALLADQPDIQWIAPPDIHQTLQSYGVTKFTDQSVPNIEVVVGQHAFLGSFGGPAQNLTVHFARQVTALGDSHEERPVKDIVFLPVDAPWGSSVGALDLALKLKPKYVLPVHDWMWKDEWRALWYGRFKEALAPLGVTFLEPVDGQPIEISL